MTNFGAKIAKPGIDVRQEITEANKKDFVLLDQVNCLKKYLSGRVNVSTTINHNLGYVPVFDAYKIKISDSTVQLVRPDDGDWNVAATTTTLVITKIFSGSSYDLFYAIFLI